MLFSFVSNSKNEYFRFGVRGINLSSEKIINSERALNPPGDFFRAQNLKYSNAPKIKSHALKKDENSNFFNFEEAILYASRDGFPSPNLGEMLTSFSVKNDTIFIDIPTNYTVQRWFIRLDYDSLSSFYWWTEFACPLSCSHNGACDNMTGVCHCNTRSSDPVICTYVPVISNQWIIVTVIITVITAVVLVAFCIR